MRFYIFIIGFLFLVTLAIAAKQEQNDEYLEHNVKKYEKASHHHHHHHHKKHKAIPEPSIESKKHGKYNQESEEKKQVPKHAPVEVSPIEAEVQADVKTGHKKLAVEETKHHQDGMHLQDLTYPERQHDATNHKDEKKRSHQREKKHHKSQHSANHKVLSEGKSSEPQEEKLFAEHNAKERAMKPHPVLEDTFEPLSDEKVHKDSKSKKHLKKPKKAHEKSKKDKHYKNKSKKEKMKDKKNKKTSW